MVSKTLFVVLAICLVQSFAKPSGNEDQVQKLFTQAKDTFDTFTAEFQKTFGIENNQDAKKFSDALKTNANEFAGKLSELLTQVDKEAKAHSGEAHKVIENLKNQITETVEKIKKDHPTEAAKAKEYQESIKQTYTNLYEKAKEAAEAVAKDTSGVQEDLHKLTENVLKEVKTNFEKINTELKKNLEEHKKDHKH